MALKFCSSFIQLCADTETGWENLNEIWSEPSRNPWKLESCHVLYGTLHVTCLQPNKTWVTFPDQYFSVGWCVFAPVCASYLTLGRSLRDHRRFFGCKCHKLSTQWMTVHSGSNERSFLWLRFSINMQKLSFLSHYVEVKRNKVLNSLLFKSLTCNKNNRQINKGMSSYIALAAAFIALFHC